ncbi:hypothetical protein BpHYR1_053895 [Brachionus plicatilis]|uniref:Uncharacterized protein n=1 Tax=Brachionus plicatilis TaxID=10195 RepID=A0A3M7T1E3_BRAPC|nr:hypothetical protein BpHYR1_053895 [Brachionus plicatilis]
MTFLAMFPFKNIHINLKKHLQNTFNLTEIYLSKYYKTILFMNEGINASIFWFRLFKSKYSMKTSGGLIFSGKIKSLDGIRRKRGANLMLGQCLLDLKIYVNPIN